MKSGAHPSDKNAMPRFRRIKRTLPGYFVAQPGLFKSPDIRSSPESILDQILPRDSIVRVIPIQKIGCIWAVDVRYHRRQRPIGLCARPPRTPRDCGDLQLQKSAGQAHISGCTCRPPAWSNWRKSFRVEALTRCQRNLHAPFRAAWRPCFPCGWASSEVGSGRLQCFGLSEPRERLKAWHARRRPVHIRTHGGAHRPARRPAARVTALYG
jgi:hypothetical protein